MVTSQVADTALYWALPGMVAVTVTVPTCAGVSTPFSSMDALPVPFATAQVTALPVEPPSAARVRVLPKVTLAPPVMCSACCSSFSRSFTVRVTVLGS